MRVSEKALELHGLGMTYRTIATRLGVDHFRAESCLLGKAIATVSFQRQSFTEFKADQIGSFFFYCPATRTPYSYRPVCFVGRIGLTYITDLAIRPIAASGGLSPSVYSPWNEMQPDIHAHVEC
jgi:hypothetical protein